MAENKAVFTVRGIESVNENQHFKDELDDVDGVMGVDTDHEHGEVSVRYDADLLAEERIEITVRDTGYDVE